MFRKRNNKTTGKRKVAISERASAFAGQLLEAKGKSAGITRLEGCIVIDYSNGKTSLEEYQQKMSELPWAVRDPYIEINDLDKRQTFVAPLPAKLLKDSVIQLVEIHCPNSEETWQLEINQIIDNHLKEEIVDGDNNFAPGCWIRLRLPPLSGRYKFYKRLRKAGWLISEQSLEQAAWLDKDNGIRASA